MFGLGFSAGVAIGAVFGASLVITFILGILTEDRFDVSSVFNKRREGK